MLYLHSWLKATLHAFWLPPPASPCCWYQRKSIKQKQNKPNKGGEKYCNHVYPGGAVGHLSRAVTVPINKAITQQLQLKYFSRISNAKHMQMQCLSHTRAVFWQWNGKGDWPLLGPRRQNGFTYYKAINVIDHIRILLVIRKLNKKHLPLNEKKVQNMWDKCWSMHGICAL